MPLRVRRIWCIAILFPLVVTVLLAGGCGNDPEVANGDRVGREGSSPGSAPTPPTGGFETPVASIQQVAIADIEEVALSPLWQKEFDDVVTASVSSRGDFIAALSYFGWGSWERIGVDIYRRDGETVANNIRWYKSTYRNGWAKWGSTNDLLMVYMNNYQTDGRFYIYDTAGQQQWSYFVDGSASAHMTADGSRIALINDSKGRLHLLNGDGERLAFHYIERGASGQFSANGERLAVIGDQQVQGFDSDGNKSSVYSVPEVDRLDVRLSPDARTIAATTGSSDSRLYLFDLATGEAISSHLLLPGGSSRLRFSDDSTSLLVYNVGSSAGVSLYDLTDKPRLLWRRSLAAVHKGRAQETKAAWISKDVGRIVAHYVESYSRDSEYVEDNWLLVFDLDGNPLHRMYLGENTDIALSSDLTTLATTANNPIDRIGYVHNDLMVYDLTPLLQPEDPE